MTFTVMDDEHFAFMQANLPDPTAVVINIPAGHDSMFHPNNWTYKQGQLIGPNNTLTNTNEISLVEKVG